MVDKYKVVTLCGSTRFKDEFIAAEKRLTLEGNIVLSVGFFGEVGDSAKEMLDDIHKRKIDMASGMNSTGSRFATATTASRPGVKITARNTDTEAHPQGASESLCGVKIKTVAPLRVQKKRFQKGN